MPSFDYDGGGPNPEQAPAGTQPIAEAVGFVAAIDYLNDVGLDAIEDHERELLVYALERMAEVPGLVTYGPAPERRAGIISFNLETEVRRLNDLSQERSRDTHAE